LTVLRKIFSPNPFKTFYIVFAYVIAFAVWWAYLLYEKNETAYRENIELNRIAYQHEKAGSNYFSTTEFEHIHAKYKRQKLMIITEGLAFIFLLMGGLLRVRKVFLREIQLAEQQRNFLLSITHELKSPLAAIKLSLQTISTRKLDVSQSEKLLANSLTDVNRFETLVENILFAAKMEHDEPGFANEEVNISELVNDAAERFQHNKKNIHLTANVQSGIYLQTDSMGFTSVVFNLIENAIKYSSENTTVEMELYENDTHVLLTVSDTGIGISDDDKIRVFDKFYRAGNENTRNTKGTGLGLYIVKRFVEIYKGDIQIADNSPTGSVFKLQFPKAS
jgi:signal transduction histidine kinase